VRCFCPSWLCAALHFHPIGDKQHPCLTPLPLTFCTRSSRTLTRWSKYNLQISFLARQSIPVSFRFYVSLVQFTQNPSYSVWSKSTQFVTCVRSSFWYTLCCHNKKAYKKTRSWCWGYWNSRIRHGLQITHLLRMWLDNLCITWNLVRHFLTQT
jgi:hypothetical protein